MVSESRAERESLKIASTFFYKRLLVRIMTSWRKYVDYKQTKREQDREKIVCYEKLQTRLIHKEYFELWERKTNEAIEERRKTHLAESFYEIKLKKLAYLNWRVHISCCHKVKIQEKQANAFLEMRLKAQFFIKWRLEQQEALAMRDRNVTALLLWSTNVLKKCLFAWIEWYRLKKVNFKYKFLIFNFFAFI